MSAKRAKKKAKKTAPKAAARKAPKKAAKRSAARTVAKPRGPQILHWEIQSQSPDKLHGFYADVFGWKIDTNNPMRYGLVSSGRGNGGIDGGIGGSPSPGSRVVVYANVPSIPTVLDKIESLGGTTIMPRTDLGMVIIAQYLDPEGNVMGLMES
jgi:predicted enzyme related to lactoylglutathione lyase